MSTTILDPNTALVVIDLRKGIAALPTVHPMDGVVANSVERIFPKLGETGTTQAIVALLDQSRA